MRPVVSVAEMVELDARAVAERGQRALIEAAGAALAAEVSAAASPIAGKRVAIVAGPGSNGEDGRVAAAHLEAAGAVVALLGPAAGAAELEGADVVVDAAFGTGLSRPYEAPAPPASAAVVAVDLPSGLDGNSGALVGRPMAADLTVAMAAIKAGLLFGSGPGVTGDLHLADVGIDVSAASAALLDESDLEAWPLRRRDAHKWSAAVTVVAGGPGMEGAGALSSLGALRAGAGMVRLVHPVDGGSAVAWPLELVRRPSRLEALAAVAAEETARSGAIVIGPGLGSTPATHQVVRELIASRRCPSVLDADGLSAAGTAEELGELVSAARAPVVITPHDGEARRLLGHEVGDDRLAAARELAERSGAIALLKGPTTVVARPGGGPRSALISRSGSEALATAGTGDVLSGIIAAALALGSEPLLAAGLSAELHGLAGRRASGVLIASELPVLVGELIGGLRRGR